MMSENVTYEFIVVEVIMIESPRFWFEKFWVKTVPSVIERDLNWFALMAPPAEVELQASK